MDNSTDDYRPLAGHKQPNKKLCAQLFRTAPTEAERILWSRLRANRLLDMHFRRQHVIAGFIVDFYCHEAKLVVEVDGGVHNKQQEYDQERDQVLRSLGLCVQRFTNEDVKHNLRHVVLTIGATLNSNRTAAPLLGTLSK